MKTKKKTHKNKANGVGEEKRSLLNWQDLIRVGDGQWVNRERVAVSQNQIIECRSLVSKIRDFQNSKIEKWFKGHLRCLLQYLQQSICDSRSYIFSTGVEGQGRTYCGIPKGDRLLFTINFLQAETVPVKTSLYST